MRIALIIIACVGAFAIGGAGMYFLMPTLAPQIVEEFRQSRDSLAVAAETTMTGAGAAFSYDTTVGHSLPASTDSLHEAVNAVRARALARIALLKDSLTELDGKLREVIATAQKKEAVIEDLQATIAGLNGRRQQVADFSKTLADLGDDELQAILAEVDMDVLTRLYASASGRDRTRLLQALSAQRAAQFVNAQLADGKPALTETVASTDESGSSR